MSKNIVYDILKSKARVNIDYSADNMTDIMNFGFSYIEHMDHIVEYIVANNKIMKRVFGQVNDSVLKPHSQYIGELWTAKLLLSNKLNDNQVLFSNNIFSVVINLDLSE
ncbi:hypothetical protein DRQ07_11540 [candidate division KSB1 bacterium]|nr:MAG: hypothetical protein DRQ07_11540 [candidate division KSB1 bacterium]